MLDLWTRYEIVFPMRITTIDKKIDCVFIKLYENVSEESMYNLISVNNSIKDFKCKIIGFPKLLHKKIL